jgi:GntR family transcriptional repressor for pyruvate dehydrogenase complex
MPQTHDPLAGLHKVTAKAKRAAKAPSTNERLAAQIVDQMRAAIFSGMKPGEWIGTESELAERFGVSKVATRAAIQTLRTYGLVAVKVGGGGGLFVAREDPKHVGEALAVQLHLMDVDWNEAVEATTSLEPILASLASKRRTDEHLMHLRALLEEQRGSLHDPAAFDALSTDIHMSIAEASGNRALLVAAQAFRLNQENNSQWHADRPAVTARLFEEHQQIITAIEAEDANEAVRLMDLHNGTLAQTRRDESRRVAEKETPHSRRRAATQSAPSRNGRSVVATNGSLSQSGQ